MRSTVLSAVFLIACAGNVAAEVKLYDLRSQCADQRDVNEFADDILRTADNPVASEIADYRVFMVDAAEAKAQNAYRQLLLVERFFGEELQYDSADGRGTPIHLMANFDSTEQGPQQCQGMNAFMSSLSSGGRFKFLMGVLQGVRGTREDIADDLDVLGHEFAHGVFVANYAGANLNSLEVGGVNEAVGDIFGVTIRAWYESGQGLSRTVIRADSFEVGRTFAAISARHLRQPFPGGVMRNNLNPAQQGDADHYEYVTQSQLEVHTLSGIVTLAYALLVKGGSHPRINGGPAVHGIGFEKAIKIVFYALKHRLPFNNMREFALAVRRSAERLHGEGSLEWRSTNNAFAAVGLLQPVEPYPPQVPEPAPRQEPSADQEASPSEPQTEPVPESVPADETQMEPRPEPESPSAPEQPQPTPPAEVPVPQHPEPTAPGTEPDSAPPEPGTPVSEPPITVTGPQILVALGVAILLLLVLGGMLKKRRLAALQQIGSSAPDVQKLDSPVAEAASGSPRESVQATAPALASADLVAGSSSGMPGLPESNTATLSIGGTELMVELDREPLVIGRAPAVPLPEPLTQALSADGAVSRRHFEIWYEPESVQLYFRCLSGNGLQVNDHHIEEGQKAKVDFYEGTTVVAGETTITVKPV